MLAWLLTPAAARCWSLQAAERAPVRQVLDQASRDAALGDHRGERVLLVAALRAAHLAELFLRHADQAIGRDIERAVDVGGGRLDLDGPRTRHAESQVALLRFAAVAVVDADLDAQLGRLVVVEAAQRFEQYGDELESVLAAMKQSRELGFVLVNPGYTQPQRHAVVDAVAGGLKLSAVTVNFLRLLVDRQRMGALAEIARVYRALVDRQAGRIRATVTSAGPLSEHELERLREAIGRTTGRAVVLESKTDSSLIGGVVAQVGPTMMDGSLRTQLERMRHELKRGPL